MLTSLSVANNFILKAKLEKIQITPMKLQKLLYMLYAYYYVRSGEPLFSDRFEAWQYGPVIPDVYHEFSMFGKTNIDRLYCSNDGTVYIGQEVGLFGECLNYIWETFKNFNGMQLSSITHEDNTAWSKTNQGSFLNDEDIRNDGQTWFIG